MKRPTSAACLETGWFFRPAVFGAVMLATLVCVPVARAQQGQEIGKILERLDRLERQNAELLAEIQQLRQQIAASGSTPAAPAAVQDAVEKVNEKVDVQAARIEEQSQSKVESLQRYPIRITGMALFNAFTNSRSEGAYFSSIATHMTSNRASGATLSQSMLGLEFFGPEAFLDAKIHGNLQMDFYPYTAAYGTIPQEDTADFVLSPRLRTGGITLDWGSRRITLGQDKPLISPRDPDSLAQVGVPALADAGNLWEWRPQVRLEQKFNLSSANSVTAQAALYSTRETNTTVPAEFASTQAATRPGWEARVQFAHRRGDDPFLEIAPGFHFSVSHAAGYSVDSRIISMDGLFRPLHVMEFTGSFFTGANTAGLGGLGPGYSVTDDGDLYAVHSRGGWLQMALFPTQRLSFHLFGGTQENRRSNLNGYYPQANISMAGNIYYRLAPNVILAFEAAQSRTTWTNESTHLRNHYDLALAYMF